MVNRSKKSLLLVFVFILSIFSYSNILASSSGTLIFSDSNYYNNQYPRVVKLSNGDLLSTFNKIGNVYSGFPIYKSSNNGTSWDYITTVNPSDYGISTGASACPTLFVLPNQMGNFSAGTILLAYTLNASATSDKTQNTIQIVRSTNNGTSWQQHSSLESGTNGQTWEPELAVSSDGKLICYFSDERQSGYSQTISHKVSTDGGVNWGTYKIDVGVQDGNRRPGMPRVVKLKNSNYFMIYEVMNAPDHDGGIRYRTSADGINWGDATNLGTLIQTSNGDYPKQTPELGFIDDGSTNGRLFVRGMNDVIPNRNSNCFTNTNNGLGTWEVTDSPLTLNGGQDVGAAWSGTYLSLNNSSMLEINTVYNGSFIEIKSAVGNYKQNVAQGKSAWASSQWDNNFPASKAVDGDSVTGWSASSTDKRSWWEVDIGSAKRITKIEIPSRSGYDQPESRRNFEIWASNNSDMGQGHVVLGSCGSSGFSNGSTWTLNVNDTNTYRYLAVVKTADEYMYIAEFRAYN